ncbi:hypothetical protein [Streptomyces sp. LaPpAH-108]|uniref:hypothetical protein n=1 Tax=Streptomyces sp. LaPpAH-108 TaxID=1155714 RepID=UPI00037F35E0|nr:hypothetical protein [Streptomyces sp. LaPpAH-108]
MIEAVPDPATVYAFAEADLRLNAQPVDYALIAVYFTFVLGIGVLARRKVASDVGYLQTLFGFFIAPLFTTFTLGMFWKRACPAADSIRLIVGTASAVTIDPLSLTGVLHASRRGAGFLGVLAVATALNIAFC